MRSLRSLGSLEGRVALITGGAGHLGQAIAEALGELGAGLVLLDLDPNVDGIAAQIGGRWEVPAFSLQVDLARESAVRDVPGQVLDRLGRLDVLVNNAALVGTDRLGGWAVPFDRQSADTWRLALEVNVTAPFVLVQACHEALVASTHGAVINIGSIYGIAGPDMALYAGTSLGNPAAYATSKGGLLQLTRWLATVLAPEVRVNAISLGGVRRGQPTEFQERYVSRTPLKRMAIEEDVKGAAAYLASDLSAYVTGQNVVIDGGWTSW